MLSVELRRLETHLANLLEKQDKAGTETTPAPKPVTSTAPSSAKVYDVSIKNYCKYRIYSNTIRILFEPAPPIEPAVVLSKFPIKPPANLCFLEIEPADCNRINTVYR